MVALEAATRLKNRPVAFTGQEAFIRGPRQPFQPQRDPDPEVGSALAVSRSVVILHQNKETGRLFLRTSIHGTGRHFTQQLNNAGEQRLFRAGPDLGDQVPRWLVEQLEEHHETYPLLGAFRGQLSLELDDKVAPRWRSRPRRTTPQPPGPGRATQPELFVFVQVLRNPSRPRFSEFQGELTSRLKSSSG